MLANVRPLNDLAHPLCRNLRDGDWMMDYTVGRLLPFVGTRQVSFLVLLFTCPPPPPPPPLMALNLFPLTVEPFQLFKSSYMVFSLEAVDES